MTAWRRVRHITMPGGFKIPVVYWSDKKIKAQVKRDANLKDKDYSGYWEGTRLVINKDEPVWLQIETFAHEIVHAAHDYGWWVKREIVEPMKLEAARTELDLNEDKE